MIKFKVTKEARVEFEKMQSKYENSKDKIHELLFNETLASLLKSKKLDFILDK